MNWLEILSPEWIQAGELGLAFIVVMLCAGLVLFVMKSSARREEELLKIITKVLPLMECLSAGLENVTAGIVAVNLRLESIEDNQLLAYNHKKPNKNPARKSSTIPRAPMEAIIEAAKVIEAKIEAQRK